METRSRQFGRLFIVSVFTFATIAVGGLHPHSASACPVGGCTNASFYGDYSLSHTDNDSPNSVGVGVLHADGAGNVTGSQTIVNDSTNPVTVFTAYVCSGTYSINSDGTGTMQFYAESSAMCTDISPPLVTFAIGLEDGGHGFRAVKTNGSGVSLGGGRLQ